MVIRWLSRGQGEVHALQTLRYLREVSRFGMLFGVTILAPALLLAYLALASIRSSELQFDADLGARADAMAEVVHAELSKVFQRFEEQTAARVQRGEAPTYDLAELSPYLRGVYRFDPNGRLAEPFELEEARSTPPAPAVWTDAMSVGRRTEARDPTLAATFYDTASQSTRIPAYVAEAQIARARALYAAGNHRAAEALLEGLRGQDWSRVRESRGHRVGDLASLMLAEHAFAADPQVGGRALRDLVEQLLATPWVIGERGEAAVVRRCLDRLAPVADEDWIARMRARLEERSTLMHWAMAVKDELELVNVRTPDAGFRYYGARLDSDALWATARTADGLYAFSFSVAALEADLVDIAARTTQLDPDLVTRLVLGAQPLPEDILTSRPLDPWMSFARVVVSPQDASVLAQRKSSQRRLRVAVITVALFVVGVGVVFSARIIGRELEGARMKADFAANVSHELRSPITQIRLKGEALQLGLVDPGDDMQQHFDAIVREAERLSRLVDNVLDFAAIERGAKKYQLRPDDLAAVVWQTVESNRDAVESKGMTLELFMPDDLPPVWIDREAIGQVLVNLLSNAAKYGSDGGWVGVTVRAGVDGVELTVGDRGMGIDTKDLDRIFEHFFRSTDPRVRRRKGTGIGLTIVRYIVEAHGGTIAVDSKPGLGTTFTLTFPLEPPEGVGDRA